MYFSLFLFHAYHTTLHKGFCFPSWSALRESMSLLLPMGAFHPCNLGLASYIRNNLASETSFNLMSRVYPRVTNRLPETSKCRCLHLKGHRIMESSSKEWMTNCETLWRPSYLGSLGRMYSCREEHSFLYLKFHFFLSLLKLPPAGVLVCTPFCLPPSGCLPTPLPIDLTHLGGLLGTCSQSGLSTTVPGEQAHLGRAHPSPMQLAQTLTTSQHPIGDNTYQHPIPLQPNSAPYLPSHLAPWLLPPHPAQTGNTDCLLG